MKHQHLVQQTVQLENGRLNTSPSVTYGTNGFFILKDGNSVTDQSGNSNNFTVGAGTLTKTEDNASNNFATWKSFNSKTCLMVLGVSTSFTVMEIQLHKE